MRLLEAIQRARRRTRLDAGERRHRHQLAARRLDLEIEQRADRRAVLVADLRNHLVAAIEVVEAVDVRAAEQRAELLPDAGEVEPQIGDPLAIEHDARLGQIDLEVGVDVQELAALPARADDGADRLRAAARAAHRSAAPARRRTGPGVGSGGSSRGNTRSPGTCDTAPYTSPYISSVERVALLPILRDHAAEAAPRRGQRPHELRLGEWP